MGMGTNRQKYKGKQGIENRLTTTTQATKSPIHKRALFSLCKPRQTSECIRTRTECDGMVGRREKYEHSESSRNDGRGPKIARGTGTREPRARNACAMRNTALPWITTHKT